jgi:putative transposase
MSGWPVRRPRNWGARVSRAETASKLAELRECVARGRPYGQKDWQERAIRALGLENTCGRADGHAS